MNILDLQGSESFRKANPDIFRPHPPTVWEAADSEHKLHQEIIELCNARRWYTIHSRMDMPTTTAVGAPDFVVVTPRGVYFVECKTKSGKLTPAQHGVEVWLDLLGRKLHIVRSLAEFQEVVK